MPSRSKSTRKTREHSSSRTIEIRDESRESLTAHKRRATVGTGFVGRLQGVEDIVFGAAGELGHAIVGDKKGARKSAEIFEAGIDTLLGRKNSAGSGATSQLSRRSVDIDILRDTYFEGYDAGIHAALSRAEAEAEAYWYNQPRQMSGGGLVLLPKTVNHVSGNAKALKQGPNSEATTYQR